MMEKKFSKFELARMKRTAQNVYSFIEKRNKMLNKLSIYEEELKALNDLIELTDAPTIALTGGFSTEDIIKKVVVVSDTVSKNGMPAKITKFEFIYPDTIIPPTKEEEIKEDLMDADFPKDDEFLL